MRRWVADLTAVHFINDVDLQMRAEKLHRSRAKYGGYGVVGYKQHFCIREKKQRVAYMAHMAELGRKVGLALGAFETWRPSAKTTKRV